MKFNYFKENTEVNFNDGLENYIRTTYNYNITDKPFGLSEKQFNILEKTGARNFKVVNNKATFKLDTTTFKLDIIEYQEQTLNAEVIESITLSKEELSNALAFIDAKGKRPIFTGVNVSGNTTTATNTFILYQATHEGSLNNSYTMNQEFVKRLLKYNQDTYTISFNNNSSMCSIELEDRNILIVGKLLSGNYPNVEKIVERPLKNRIDFNFDNLNEITKYSDKEDTLIFTQANDKLSVAVAGALEIEPSLLGEYIGADSEEVGKFILESFDKFNLIASGETSIELDNGISKLTKDNEVVVIMGVR